MTDSANPNDDAVERLLRRVQMLPSDRPLADCPDAETMAAWVDGELPANLQDRVDAHVASCERCQMVAATMARVESARGVRTTAPAGSWLRWFVPLTAAAAVLAFWVVSARRDVPAVPAATEARADLGQANAPRAQAAPPPPAAAPLTAAAAPGANRVTLEDKKSSLKDIAAARKTESAQGAAVQELGKVTSAFQTPDGAIRWRFPSGVPERSLDAGRTWTPVPIGALVTLTAGAAPDAATCWLVGRAGVVLLRVGDGPWARVAFPEAIDLTAVRAVDALHATVTTSDGRQFETVDGGATWVRRALQGNSDAAF